MNYNTFVKYKSNILFIQRLLLAVTYIQIIAGTYHLFIPSIMMKSQFDPVTGIVAGVIVNIIGILIAAKVSDLEGERSVKVLRAAVFAGIIHQYLLGLPTIYTITVFSIAVIGESLIIPKLEIIQRTQSYASREKLTKEVYQAVAHADNYMKSQLTWITNSLILLLTIGVISIFMLTIFNTLPSLFSFIDIIQIIAILAIFGLILTIVRNGFPKFEKIPSKYDLENI